MPRKIDHDVRKAELIDALWSVIHHQGVSAVSLRTVAATAGISVGSLRHVFPTRSALLTSASELMINQVTQRIRAISLDQSPVSHATKALLHLIPTDEVSRAEMEINIALIAEAGADPELLRLRDETRSAIHDLCRRLLTRVRPDASEDQLESGARRLHVIVDGLAFNLVQEPTGPRAPWAREMIEQELLAWSAAAE